MTYTKPKEQEAPKPGRRERQATAKEAVDRFKSKLASGEKPTAEEVQEFHGHLSNMTKVQLGALRRELSVKGGKLKEDTVKNIVAAAKAKADAIGKPAEKPAAKPVEKPTKPTAGTTVNLKPVGKGGYGTMYENPIARTKREYRYPGRQIEDAKQDESHPVVMLDPKALTSNQPYVHQDKLDAVKGELRQDNPVIVVKHNGKLQIEEGNHRAVKALLDGVKVPARIVDLDAVQMPPPPPPGDFSSRADAVVKASGKSPRELLSLSGRDFDQFAKSNGLDPGQLSAHLNETIAKAKRGKRLPIRDPRPPSEPPGKLPENVQQFRDSARDARSFFGTEHPPGLLAAAVNGSDGGKVDAVVMKDGSLVVESSGKGYEAMRTFYRNEDGSLTVHNDSFEIEKDSQGNPTNPDLASGTDFLASQVRSLRQMGVTKIETHAAGRPGSPVYNGYYTWPRLGYNAPLMTADLDKMPPEIRATMDDPPTIQGLYKTPQGREWWKNNGRAMAMTFDTADGSVSMQVLEAYLKERSGQS